MSIGTEPGFELERWLQPAIAADYGPAMDPQVALVIAAVAGGVAVRLLVPS